VTYREGRFRTLNTMRHPRLVSIEMRDRCALALAENKGRLSEVEERALLLIVAAWAMRAPVNGAAIDLANGVLGRLEAPARGKRRRSV
jgi:hypothetical protein